MIKNTDLKQNAQKSIRIRAEKIRNKFASITANEISNMIQDKQVCLTIVK